MSGERRQTGPHPIWARKPRGKNLPLPTREDLLRSRAEAERDRTQKPGGEPMSVFELSRASTWTEER